MVISTFASVPVEAIAQVATPPPWFQLYVQTDRGFTRDLVQRVEARLPGPVCHGGHATGGARNREARLHFQWPADVPNFKGGRIDRRLTWQDLDWLRSFTHLPVVLKGIMSPEDGARAAQEGVAGVIVSNHGGRNLDSSHYRGPPGSRRESGWTHTLADGRRHPPRHRRAEGPGPGSLGRAHRPSRALRLGSRRCWGRAACADNSAAGIGDGHGTDWTSVPRQHRPHSVVVDGALAVPGRVQRCHVCRVGAVWRGQC